MAGESSDITLYHAVPTRSCRVLFLLEELGLPYKLVKKEFKPFGLRDDVEYCASIHPRGSLPGFKDGETVIIESIAILQYLIEQYDPEHKMSPPLSDKPARAAYLNWLTFAEASYASSVVFPVMHMFVLPEEARNPTAAASFKKSAEENLKILDKALEGKPKGIVNNEFSAADIALYQTTYLAAEFLKMITPETYPNVAAWYAETAKRPAAVKAYEA
ncbi:glutathione S-transferase [Klebsormidium nitens]|uniref:Glutathione S-transferase n=1 Tax=Klebsormidium nitens TaxID=105231 RepID=A0A1Y1IBU2_KLENI|nr:glutathione S-transferase [Klebsormidium nitens]|eukprot:GAQ86561.1 glutathione S-transferase [Klebsormidium nitens]